MVSKFSLLKSLTLGAALVVAGHASAYEIDCIRDHRPADGDMVKVHLVVNEQGQGTATISEAVDSPVVSHAEETTLRALTCERQSGPFLGVDCKGPFTLNFGDMEAVGPGGNGFMHFYTVSTSYKNKSFRFGGRGSSSMPDTCEFKN